MQNGKQLLKAAGMVAVCLVCLLIVASLLPERQALTRIPDAANNLGRLAGQLEGLRMSLDALSLPSNMTTGKPGSMESYLQQLSTTASLASSEPYVQPDKLINPLGRGRAATYNATIVSDDFRATTAKSTASLARAEVLLAYQLSVMRSLKNILEYDPVSDLASTSLEARVASLQAAADGLRRTDERLRSQTFADDTYLSELRTLIADLEVPRSQYVAALARGDSTGGEYRSFIDAVSSLQIKILANRQAFWDDSVPALQDSLTNANDSLTLLRDRMNNL
jgi:hypothetical protein